MADQASLFLNVADLKNRYNKGLQRWEVRFPVFANTGEHGELDGVAGLYAWFVHNDVAPFLDGTNLKVKMRWLPVEVVDLL